MVVEPVEGGVRRRDGAVVRIAAHDAVVDAERERRVRREVGAVDLEAGPTELAAEFAGLRAEHARLLLVLRVAREDGRRHRERGIGRRREVAFEGRFGAGLRGEGGVRVDGTCCRLGRASLKDVADDRAVLAEVRHEVAQPRLDEHLFERRRPVVLDAEHRVAEIRVLRLAVGVGEERPRQHVRGHDGAGVHPEERAVLGTEFARFEPVRGQLVDQRAVLSAQLGVGHEVIAELSLQRPASGDDVRVAETLDAPGVGLARVREREVGVLDLRRLRRVGVLVHKVLVDIGARGVEVEDRRLLHVAAVLKLRDGLEARRRAGVADHEHEFAGLGAVLAPREEVVFCVERLAVVGVGAEESEVERVTWIGEVVRVAAEETEGVLGGEGEADVVVATEDVRRVLPAVVERDHLHDEVVLGRHLSLDRGDLLLPGVDALGVGLHRGDGRVDPRRHVFDLDELIDVEVLDAALGVHRCGVEAVTSKVFPLARHLRGARTRAVVIGEDEPVRRDE